MGCNCEDAGLGNTQENLVAWVQPGGAGPLRPFFYAMSDSGDYPGIKITGARKNRRGAITPIYRRSGRNPRQSVRAGSRTAAPAANTITLEFASQGCGGFMPNELIDCLLDVYQYHMCCGNAGDFDTGWSKIEVFGDIDIESNEYSDGVSYSRDDSNDLFIRHTAEFQDKLTVYPLVINELVGLLGVDTGDTMTDVTYVPYESCGNSGCGREQSCTDQWYAGSNEGSIFYKGGPNLDVTSTAIAGFPQNGNARLAVRNGRIFVAFADSVNSQTGFYWANLDAAGNPGTWTRVNLTTPTEMLPTGWLQVSDGLWLYGESSATLRARVYHISQDTSSDLIFSPAVNSTGLLDMDICGNTRIGGGRNGTIWLASGCENSFVLAPTTPTALHIFGVAIRVPNEWWIADANALVFFTLDGGLTWEEKVFPFRGLGTVSSMKWANARVGHLTHVYNSVVTVYTTWNGGRSWTASEPRISLQPQAAKAANRIAVPCCSNEISQSNTFLIAGTTSADDGAVWEATIQSCQ